MMEIRAVRTDDPARCAWRTCEQPIRAAGHRRSAVPVRNPGVSRIDSEGYSARVRAGLMMRPVPDVDAGEICTLPCVRVPPTPSDRRIDLATLDDVRLEMARVYRSMKEAKIATQDGTRLVYVLGQIGKMIEVYDIQKRLEGLERALGTRVKT
jgi:hypothetical protein